jgi:nucleotide-binding universal stress UspA family protein
VTTATPTGSAKTAIVEYADSIDADLIVMGSRGRGGVERLMLGSVTEHVVRVSDIDVLVHGGGD